MLAVAPGFVNRLSWTNKSPIADGRPQSDVRHWVTLKGIGESRPMGPGDGAFFSRTLLQPAGGGSLLRILARSTPSLVDPSPICPIDSATRAGTKRAGEPVSGGVVRCRKSSERRGMH